MREWVRTCDFCGKKIKSLSNMKIKTEINYAYQEYDICHKCERHMIRYILEARKKDTDDED